MPIFICSGVRSTLREGYAYMMATMSKGKLVLHSQIHPTGADKLNSLIHHS